MGSGFSPPHIYQGNAQQPSLAWDPHLPTVPFQNQLLALTLTLLTATSGSPAEHPSHTETLSKRPDHPSPLFQQTQ